MSFNHDIFHRIPVRGLQVFEAAARHLSFTRAADALGITQSAVSRQMSDLEKRLGVSLFVRSGPRIVLTRAGEVLFDRASRAFADLRAGVADCRVADGLSSVVTLSMLPSVAALWLAPRLEAFAEAHPEIDLRVSASRHLVSFEAEGIDLAIRYGTGNWPGVTAEFLASETVRPVCTPDYARRIGIGQPSDLLKATLIHPDTEEGWSAWFVAAGVVVDAVPSGPRFSDDTAALNAVLGHQAVFLGRSVLTARELEAGRIVAPFDIEVPASFSYWLVRPVGQEPSVACDSVRKWILRAFGRPAPDS
ncbi:LysR substrate-binding domain-containing protein [Nisaea acidiphila]|uniref:LysR substrate-binding domain-containing protein n=1 Tax=Nisaea acidiphila TaxID=1862145 RepID=A0A9J7AP74_9PROT|nr:LysR substrate-binding domain-containing protein [Nisaea acidiphila]UUX48148.1 LysR substrate-binding domain-containing protein [Nisaea acidiphila]